MRALVLLLPLVAAKSGPVLMQEAGTNGMNTNVFDGMSKAMDAAQKFSAVRRDALPLGAGSLLNPMRANVLPDASKTTLVQVKRQNTLTTTVTKKVTEKAEATAQEVLVTATVLETVKESKPSGDSAKSGNSNSNSNGNSNSNNGGKKGGEGQNAKETVTTTVTAGAQETGNANNQGNNNNNNNNNNQASQGSNNNSPEASSKSGNAEATQSGNAEARQSGNAEARPSPNAEPTGTQPTKGATNTNNAKIPMGTGGVIVPLSAVVPQGETAQSEIMGTNFAASGFTFKNKRRARKIRRANNAWWS